MLFSPPVSRLSLRLNCSACFFSSSTLETSSETLEMESVRCVISCLSHSDSDVRLRSLRLSVFRVCTVLPVVSLSRRSSEFRSSIFSRYCWFSILSWSKSITCSTSPISSLSCSCCSIFWICDFSVVFLRRSFSMAAPFVRCLSSMYRTTFSAAVFPVRKFSAPTTISRLNSYASFLISAIRMSHSSICARSPSSSFSMFIFVRSICERISSTSCSARSCFCSAVSTLRTLACFFGRPWAVAPGPCSSSAERRAGFVRER
mmetsp:Transcript_13943/g.36179  ORF Transcript_13943/g.36179 Transcript_13943/m.36179 type:complete len:260 (+) Transcript_13943:179-958(+)